MIKWNSYTWYSKTLAVILFVFALPSWTFYLGMQYGEVREIINIDKHMTFEIKLGETVSVGDLQITFGAKDVPVVDKSQNSNKKPGIMLIARKGDKTQSSSFYEDGGSIEMLGTKIEIVERMDNNNRLKLLLNL